MRIAQKKGRSTFFVVVATAAITMLFCFVLYRVTEIRNTLLYGDAEQGSGTFQKLYQVKSIIDQSFLRDYEEKDLVDEAIHGMLEALNDPYAEYYNEEEYESFATQSFGEYKGIGVYVGYQEAMKMPMVITPIINSPAAEAGILPGDYIAYVDDLSASSATYEELVDAIKGEEGTKVTIGILRNGENGSQETLEFEVERREVEINPVMSEMLDDRIGYIELSSFDQNSYLHFMEHYQGLLRNNMKGLILDLRNNPGGLLDVCVKITDEIVPKGKIVSTVDKYGKEEAEMSDAKQIEIPLVVLVNGGSASASEVFTGAVKDYGVGVIVGTKTYGKGVVQTLKRIGDGTYMKLTTAEYFSPKGNKIDGIGIEPDIVVEQPSGDIFVTKEEDVQLQTAITEMNKLLEEAS